MGPGREAAAAGVRVIIHLRDSVCSADFLCFFLHKKFLRRFPCMGTVTQIVEMYVP